MDRSPFRTLMTKNFPSAPPSLQLLEDLFIIRCTLKSWSSTLRRLGSYRQRAASAAQMSYLLEAIDWRNPQHTWRPQSAG